MKIIICIFIVLFYFYNPSYTIYGEEPKTNSSLSYFLKNNACLSISSPSTYSFLKKMETKKKAPLSRDDTYTYSILHNQTVIGELALTIRTIVNNSQFIFLQLYNHHPTPLTIDVSYITENTTNYKKVDFHRFNKEFPHHKVIGKDITTYPIGLFQTFTVEKNLQNNFILSKNYRSVQAQKVYSNKQVSKVRFLKEELENYTETQSESNTTIQTQMISKGNDISENWALISTTPLFSSTQHLDKWIEEINLTAHRPNNWYTKDGAYSKMAWSIEPFNQLGYGRRLDAAIDKRSVDLYKERKDSYFYNLIANTLANLQELPRNKTGLYLTEITSTWLKKDYGITAPFIDTRFNEIIGYQLNEIGKLFNLPSLQKQLLVYCDFLTIQAKTKAIPITGEGYLLPDYYSDYMDTLTHTSLNHQLGEMNLLLTAYFETNNPTYLETALHIRKGIEGLGKRWIKENGDTWYEVKPDLTFSGVDYERVTLEDLRLSQKNWAKTSYGESEWFQLYIDSKTNYLNHKKET